MSTASDTWKDGVIDVGRALVALLRAKVYAFPRQQVQLLVLARTILGTKAAGGADH